LQVPGWKTPLVAQDLRRRMTADIHCIHPFAGADALLGELHAAGLTLAIATSNSAGNVRAVLGAQALRCVRYLETGVSIHGKGARLRRLLRRAGVPAAAAVYIGDELRDIEAARAAGVSAGAVTWGYNRADALRRARPHLVFERLQDIAPRLLSRSRL
jgi:phosphoglycolate phosphatase